MKDKRGLIVMPFGKNKGKMMKDIPDSYLQWCIDNKVLKGKKRLYALDKLGIERTKNPPKPKLKTLELNDYQSLCELANQLAIDTGISRQEKVLSKSTTHKSHWILNGKDVGPLFKRAVKGGVVMYTNFSPNLYSRIDRSKEKLYSLDTKFDEVYYMRDRLFTEFGIEFKPIGRIKVCEGNGWYSHQNVYEYKSKYYS